MILPIDLTKITGCLVGLRRFGDYSWTARSFLSDWLPPLFLMILLFGVWEMLVRLMDVPQWLLPAPSVIGAELIGRSGLLLQHTLVTLQEILAGFGIALITGVILAIAIAFSRILERSIYPFVIASQTIPIIAIAPLLLVWIGYDIRPKILVVALIAFFPLVVNMVDGLKSVDSDSIKMFRTLGATPWQTFRKLQIPGSLPYLFSGMKISVAIAVIGAVIGEWIGASSGLGYLMLQASPRFQTPLVFASIAILSFIGIALFLLINLCEYVFLPWDRERRRLLQRRS